MANVSEQSTASSAVKTVPVSVSQVAMSFNPTDHTLQVSFSRVKQVLYTIRYQLPVVLNGADSTAAATTSAGTDVSVITQALTHRGLADTQGRFMATHFLGSESGDQKIKHEVKTGIIQANIITAQGGKERLVKEFTIDAQNQVTLKDAATAVEALPESAVLGVSSDLATPAPSPIPVVAAATPTHSNNILSGAGQVSGWAWLIVAGIILMVIVVMALLRQSRDVSNLT